MFDARNRAMTRRPAGPASSVLRFMAGSVLAILVIVLGAQMVLRDIATQEAERDARVRVGLEGRLVETALTDGLLTSEPASLRKIDDLVSGVLLTDDVARIKIWSARGEILYADDPALIGKRYPLGDDELEVLRTGGAEVDVSDLDKPENVSERGQGQLIETYSAVRVPSGEQVLYESYRRSTSVMAPGNDLLRQLALPLIAGIVVLLLAQAPLAVTMARRLRRQHEQQEALLTGALDAASHERTRLASRLHDGPVQQLAGVAFGLEPLAGDARAAGDAPLADRLDDAAGHLRQTLRDLRAVTVELHPAALEQEGLAAALEDLLSPLERAGVKVSLIVHGPAESDPRDPLIYQVCRELLRNVELHADATAVVVDIDRPQGVAARIEVRDDGRGFRPADRAARRSGGHLGLDLLEAAAVRAGAVMTVNSAPEVGTTVVLNVPAP